ncbi:hypothetical protein LTR17_024273 [Elasticomyces elasticus]|nr:hypothetical protein LTR17_024273 [Elasticomyces elasticus]
MAQDEAPSITTLFQVVFDQKVGYTTAWKRSIPDLDLSGVEYKSLPSGLHGVKSDLVYFVHDGEHVGVSAFARQEAGEAQRNASFCAVGVLMAHGRLGKGWVHAPDLRRLADGVLKHNDVGALEQFWEQHRADNGSSRRTSSPDDRRSSFATGLKRKRGLSGVSEGNAVAEDHPALHMPAMLDLFGPLLFPLHRAALLRERILLLGSPPVQANCNSVYILSVLASIPHAAAESLQSPTEALIRPQPLYSVGVADIASLSGNNGRTGWIATTTDDILGEKHQLYDVLVDLPRSASSPKRRWPQLRTAQGRIVRASQRDLRRYRMLRNKLKHLRLAEGTDEADGEFGGSESDETPMLDPRRLLAEPVLGDEPMEDEGEVVESISWTATAYRSLLWWASAGATQEDAEAEEEARFERELLRDLPGLHDVVSDGALPQADSDEARLFDAEETATVLTAYFHHLTALLLTSLASIVNEADDETEEGVEEDAIVVTVDDMRSMGLDASSENDAEFVRAMMKLWFGREATVAEGGVSLCGVRVC